MTSSLHGRTLLMNLYSSTQVGYSWLSPPVHVVGLQLTESPSTFCWVTADWVSQYILLGYSWLSPPVHSVGLQLTESPSTCCWVTADWVPQYMLLGYSWLSIPVRLCHCPNEFTHPSNHCECANQAQPIARNQSRSMRTFPWRPGALFSGNPEYV
jgi:hypothetical protein